MVLSRKSRHIFKVLNRWFGDTTMLGNTRTHNMLFLMNNHTASVRCCHVSAKLSLCKVCYHPHLQPMPWWNHDGLEARQQPLYRHDSAWFIMAVSQMLFPNSKMTWSLTGVRGGRCSIWKLDLLGFLLLPLITWENHFGHPQIGAKKSWG